MTAAKEDLSSIPPEFHEVVRKYGREMYALVMNAGMAGQAAMVLGAICEQVADPRMSHAVGVLATSFNQIANALVVAKGWDEALIAQCDRDIQLAFRGKIHVPGEQLVLDS